MREDRDKDTPAKPLAELLAWQAEVLPRVSRTFALTIPQLPKPLSDVVGNAYLLCRIADAIEDDENVAPQRKAELHRRLIGLLDDEARGAEAFAADAAAALTESTVAAERELVAETARVLEITRSFEAGQRAAIQRCIDKMCRGMPEFQHSEKALGLPSQQDMDRYCYFVAGVVGEMLTDLFCAQAPEVASRAEEMHALDVSFGQGLQMTNILKDVWEDAERGSCWLPRDVFAAAGYDLAELAPDHDRQAFEAALEQLVGIAHGHLRNALRYTLLIPPSQPGIRLFCLWSIGLAVLTLRKIIENPGYTDAEQVKVSRRAVAAVIATTRVCVRSDAALTGLFALLARKLPPAPDVAVDAAAVISSHNTN